MGTIRGWGEFSFDSISMLLENECLGNELNLPTTQSHGTEGDRDAYVLSLVVS
jgi:hypothetical protein